MMHMMHNVELVLNLTQWKGQAAIGFHFSFSSGRAVRCERFRRLMALRPFAWCFPVEPPPGKPTLQSPKTESKRRSCPSAKCTWRPWSMKLPTVALDATSTWFWTFAHLLLATFLKVFVCGPNFKEPQRAITLHIHSIDKSNQRLP